MITDNVKILLSDRNNYIKEIIFIVFDDLPCFMTYERIINDFNNKFCFDTSADVQYVWSIESSIFI